MYNVYGADLDEALQKVKPYLEQYKSIIVFAVGQYNPRTGQTPTSSGVPSYSDDIGVYMKEEARMEGFASNRPVKLIIYVVEE